MADIDEFSSKHHWIRAYQWEIVVGENKLPFLDASLMIDTGANGRPRVARLEVRRAVSVDPRLRWLAQTNAAVDVVLRSCPGSSKGYHADGKQVVMRFNLAKVDRYYLSASPAETSRTNIRGLRLELPDNLGNVLDVEREAEIANMVAHAQKSAGRDGPSEVIKDMMAMGLLSRGGSPGSSEESKGVSWLRMVKAVAEGLRLRLAIDRPPRESRGINNLSKGSTLECVVLVSDDYQLDAGRIDRDGA